MRAAHAFLLAEGTVVPWAAAGAFCFPAAVGIAFGLYPAWRASKLDPVMALRQV